MTPRRIALYTHSTNPRGGVVHTLELGDALSRAGHDVTVLAPDPSGKGFFRRTAAREIFIPAAPAPASLPAMMVQRIAEISRHIRAFGQNYDIHHAQDSINANALLACVESGDIKSFLRTVHHVDAYTDPKLRDWQHRGIHGAAKCFCVSELWQKFLANEHGLLAEIVPNGVSLSRFSALPTPRDAPMRTKLGLGQGPIFLAIGGIEARKNTINILLAFNSLAHSEPKAQLIIAGGASLLDHRTYQSTFKTHLAASKFADQIILTGPLPDEDIPSLYRIADALVFPSVKEGFGLVVLEALATGTPVIVSRIAPFTEYLTEFDCHFADPHDPNTIAAAMQNALAPQARQNALRAKAKIVSRMSWEASAARHAALYDQYCKAPAYA
jgi:glycosyltransferase-like protein